MYLGNSIQKRTCECHYILDAKQNNPSRIIQIDTYLYSYIYKFKIGGKTCVSPVGLSVCMPMSRPPKSQIASMSSKRPNN